MKVARLDRRAFRRVRPSWRRAGGSPVHSRINARQGWRRGRERTDHGRRHRDQRPRHLCPRRAVGAAGHEVPGRLRCPSRSAQGGQGHGRRQVRQQGLRHLPRPSRTAAQGHRRRADCHGRLAHAGPVMAARARMSTSKSPVRCRWARAGFWPMRCALRACFRSERSGGPSTVSSSRSTHPQRKVGEAEDPARLPGVLRGGPHGERPPTGFRPSPSRPGDVRLGPLVGTAPLAALQRRIAGSVDGWPFHFNAGGGWLVGPPTSSVPVGNQSDGTTPIEFEPVGPEAVTRQAHR